MKYQTTELSDQAKKARREYQRKWRATHPGKSAEYNKRYWEKKVKEGE